MCLWKDPTRPADRHVTVVRRRDPSEEQKREREREREHRAELLTRLEVETATIRDAPKATHGKRVCALRSNGRLGRFVRIDQQGRPQINREKVKAEEKLDGKYVVHTSDDSLTLEDVALGYKPLMRVEEA